VAIGPNINVRDVDFELKMSLINMVQANPFFGKSNEDANTRSWSYARPKSYGASQLMPSGSVYQWFYKNKEVIITWDKFSTAFLAKLF